MLKDQQARQRMAARKSPAVAAPAVATPAKRDFGPTIEAITPSAKMVPNQAVSGVTPSLDGKAVYNNVFGPQPTDAEKAQAAERLSWQGMMQTMRNEAAKRKTDAARMARVNALGNVLTTIVQPLGWAAGGATAGVQQYDDRQYIDAFNRALKADEDLSRIGIMDAEHEYQLTNEARKRAQSIEDAEKAAELKERYAALRQEQELEKIEARGDINRDLAELKARARVTKAGKDVNEMSLKTAITQYYQYKRRWLDQVGAGVERKDKLMTLSEFLRNDMGYDVKETLPGSAAQTSGSTGNSGNSGSKGKSGGFRGASASTNTNTKTGGFR